MFCQKTSTSETVPSATYSGSIGPKLTDRYLPLTIIPTISRGIYWLYRSTWNSKLFFQGFYCFYLKNLELIIPISMEELKAKKRLEFHRKGTLFCVSSLFTTGKLNIFWDKYQLCISVISTTMYSLPQGLSETSFIMCSRWDFLLNNIARKKAEIEIKLIFKK